MRVVGRSGAVMDLPEQLARSLLRNGTVEPVQEPEAEPAPAPATSPDAPAKAGAAEVRAWAAENGIDCPAKGRVPLKVVQAYIQAHKEG